MSLSDIILKVTTTKFLERRDNLINYKEINPNIRNYLYIGFDAENKFREIKHNIIHQNDKFHFEQLMYRIMNLSQESGFINKPITHQDKINNITKHINENKHIIENYKPETKEFLLYAFNVINKPNFKFKLNDYKKIKEKDIRNHQNGDIQLLFCHIFNILVDILFIWDQSPESYLDDIKLLDNATNKYGFNYKSSIHNEYRMIYNHIFKLNSKEEFDQTIDNLKEIIQVLENLKTKYKNQIKNINKNIKNLIVEFNKPKCIDFTKYNVTKLKNYCKDNNIILDKKDKRIDIENKIKNYISNK